jgi:Di- and tricarboxylate transporters
MLLMGASSLVGSFMSSTATAAIFIPITMAVAEKADINHKRLLIPLAAASLISGMMTLVATTPNIVVNNVLRERGQEPLSFFSFTPFGLVILALAIGFMLLWGRHLLAARRTTVKRRQERSIEDLLHRYGIDQRVSLLRVTAKSDLIDRSVARMQLGAHHHINLIALHTITDSGRAIVPARPESVFHADDLLVVIGTPARIAEFAAAFFLETMELPDDPALRRNFFQVIGVGEVMLTPDSTLIGKSIREIRFYSQFQCQVLAIRRKGATLTTHFADQPLKFGDVLLMGGAWDDILRLRRHRDQYLLLTLPQDYHEVIAARDRAPIALGILAVMVGLMVFDLLPTVTAVLGATAALILTRCVQADSCYKAIDWQTIVLIAGILLLALGPGEDRRHCPGFADPARPGRQQSAAVGAGHPVRAHRAGRPVSLQYPDRGAGGADGGRYRSGHERLAPGLRHDRGHRLLGRLCLAAGLAGQHDRPRTGWLPICRLRQGGRAPAGPGPAGHDPARLGVLLR